MSEAIDFSRLDLSVARAQKLLEHALARLPTDEPFGNVREVTTRSTFLAARDWPGPALEKAAFARWIHELLQARIGWDLKVAEAEAIKKPDPELPPGRPGEVERVARTFEEAFGRVLDATQTAALEIALDRLRDLAPPVVAVRREERIRRLEAANLLDLSHPWSLASEGDVFALASDVLTRTDAIAEEMFRERTKRIGTRVTVAGTIDDALGRDAQEGWPARLGRRWLEEAFRVPGARAPKTVSIARALGGASFLRAASAWGHALRLAGVARTLPFVLAVDPYPTEAWLFGSAFASVVVEPVFAKKRLGLAARTADAHRRTLSRTLLFTLRDRAAIVLLGRDARASEEHALRVFGAPLGDELGALWADGGFSGASRVDAPARFLGAVRSHAFVRDLVDRYDDDWFDNPRAASHLVGIATGPVWNGEVPPPSAVSRIARAFEDALG